jgi:hypothetical protein
VHPQDYDGSNLALWLVNSSESVVERDLKNYSQEFLQFWREQRAAYWPKVAKAKKEFQKKQKKNDQTDNGVDGPEVSMIFML